MTKQHEHDTFIRRVAGKFASYLAAALVAGLSLVGGAAAQELVPFFSKSFSPDTIGPGSVTTLTFTIGNESSSGIRGLRFEDKLPTGMTIASPANIFTDCGGSLSAPAGGNIIGLTGGSVPGNGSCTIRVDVTSSTIGGHTNISEDLISDAGNSGSATAVLNVVEELPGFSKSFSPNKIGVGGRSTLTFTIDNSSNEGSRYKATFTDLLPAGMMVADPANATKTCVGGVITAVPGSNVISYAPGVSEFLPSVGGFESCTVSVDVIGTGVGIHNNISGELTSTSSLQDFTFVSSGKASASLEVVNDPIIVTKSFLDDPVPPGGTTRLQFRVTSRSRDDVARDINFTDDLEAMLPGLVSISPAQSDICGDGSVIEGASELKFSGGVLQPGQSCTFSVNVRVPAGAESGAYPNITSPIEADVGGSLVQGSPATDTLFVSPIPRFTKEFIDDPVTAGGMVTLEFSITNTSLTSDATEISFVDELPAELVSAVSLPESGFCGPQSTLTFTPSSDFASAQLTMSGGSLKPGETCSFQVVLDIAESASTGVATNTTGPLTAMIDDVTVTAPPASDDLRIIAGPQLTKTFLDDPVLPGGTVILRFTLSHGAEVPGNATEIRFTDDLGAVIPGMVALGLPRNDICGDGSLVRGTSVIDFRGGVLKPGETCSFDIPVRVPQEAPLGYVTNTTSMVLSEISGSTVASAAAVDDLLVTSLSLTKAFLSSPVIPGDTAILEFTLTNDGSVDATNIFFTDDLDDALPGLVSVTDLQTDICGIGSTLQGTNFLVFQGGIVPAQSSCTFSVKVLVPTDAAEGDYINTTSQVQAEIDKLMLSLPGASAVLNVSDRLLAIEKTFLRNPVLPGELVGLEFTITNLDAANTATNISFTDALPAGILGAGGVQQNICGPGSQISGQTTLTFTGGRLNAGASCSFIVPVLVPEDVTEESIVNITSDVTGTINGLIVRGDPASATLHVIVPPVPGDLFQITRSELRPDGSYVIEWFGIRGVFYCVQTSINLIDWDVIEPEFEGLGDFLQFIDPASDGPRRFYKLVAKFPEP